MLMELGQSDAALTEYETSIEKEPDRFRGLYGAARAAETSGNMPQGAHLGREVRRSHGAG